MSRALVLNATFEPLCVVSDRRAVVLVLGETAEMLHASEALMHSAHLVIAVPSTRQLAASGRGLVKNSCAEANVCTWSPAEPMRSLRLSRNEASSSTTKTNGFFSFMA